MGSIPLRLLCLSGAFMGTISSAFSMMSSSLDADQAALNVVANNVANANTTGYAVETPNWQENQPISINGVESGDGASETMSFCRGSISSSNLLRLPVPGFRRSIRLRLCLRPIPARQAPRQAISGAISPVSSAHFHRLKPIPPITRCASRSFPRPPHWPVTYRTPHPASIHSDRRLTRRRQGR